MKQNVNIKDIIKLHNMLSTITSKYDVAFYSSFYYKIYTTFNDVIRLSVANYNESSIIVDMYLFVEKKVIRKQHTTSITLIGIEIFTKEQVKEINLDNIDLEFKELSRSKLAFSTHSYTCVKGSDIDHYYNDVLHNVHNILIDTKTEIEEKHLHNYM
jgi:hypothetical protein